jgi:hypothetical protein
MGRLRYRLLSGETRSFVLYACVAPLFIAGPFLAGWLDAHGLPGAGLVLIAIALAALAAGYAVYSALPATLVHASSSGWAPISMCRIAGRWLFRTRSMPCHRSG